MAANEVGDKPTSCMVSWKPSNNNNNKTKKKRKKKEK